MASEPIVLPLPGHSLGGALAQLAAHEISTAAAAEGLYIRVVCYTFGAPRVRFAAMVSQTSVAFKTS